MRLIKPKKSVVIFCLQPKVFLFFLQKQNNLVNFVFRFHLVQPNFLSERIDVNKGYYESYGHAMAYQRVEKCAVFNQHACRTAISFAMFRAYDVKNADFGVDFIPIMRPFRINVRCTGIRRKSLTFLVAVAIYIFKRKKSAPGGCYIYIYSPLCLITDFVHDDFQVNRALELL